ncbi:MAG: DUF1003 domain-containing protein [Planctomycetaceae bacterium]|nr:DUF1003 domain-containing protein [Planctomycetaceae bacterium]
MSKHPITRRTCQICQKEWSANEVMPAAIVRPAVVERIQQDHPQWSAEGFICFADLNRYRTLYVERILTKERGELSELDSEVIRSLQQQELLSANINEEFADDQSLGARLADKIASFGGGWTFLISFAVFIGTWIVVNSILIATRPFDPFPFILLNLMLSCLAAIQAPVIMMSQNRQEAKDRVRAEHDYRVNLKAELEIRHLHAKLDMLLTHQWQRLLEIQEIQMELMQESRKNNHRR